jgi:hypothetical protein
MRAKSASALPSRKTSCIAECIAFMVWAKAASTASIGELDFSHELKRTMKQSRTKRKRAEHVPRAEVRICWITFIMNPTSWLRDLSLRPVQSWSCLWRRLMGPLDDFLVELAEFWVILATILHHRTARIVIPAVGTESSSRKVFLC